MHLRVFCIDFIQNYHLKKFLEIQTGGGGGGGSSGPGNPGRRGGGSKKHAIRWGVWIFFWNNPFDHGFLRKLQNELFSKN